MQCNNWERYEEFYCLIKKINSFKSGNLIIKKIGYCIEAAEFIRAKIYNKPEI